MIHVVCSQCRSKSFDVHFAPPERFDICCSQCAARIPAEVWQSAIDDGWAAWRDEKHSDWIKQQEMAMEGVERAQDASESERCWFCGTHRPDDGTPGRLTLLFTKTLLDAQRAANVPPPHVQVSVNISLPRCVDCAKKQNRATRVAAIGAFLLAIPGLLLLGNFVMQYFSNPNVSDRAVTLGLVGIALIGIGVGVFKILIKAAHKGMPTIKDHPIPVKALASGWEASTSDPGLTKW